jgi:hypothetical protein
LPTGLKFDRNKKYDIFTLTNPNIPSNYITPVPSPVPLPLLKPVPQNITISKSDRNHSNNQNTTIDTTRTFTNHQPKRDYDNTDTTR